MEVHVEKEGDCFCRVTVKVDAAAVDAAYDRASRKVSRTARMPGFRPGKVPKSLLARQYGPQIEQEAIDAVVQGSLFAALQQQKLAPVNTPSLESIELRRGEPCTYKVSIETRPDVTITEWKGLEVPEAKGSADPAAVDAELERMRDEAAQNVPVTDRDLVGPEDLVLLDYLGTIDGVPFAGGKSENVLVDVAGKTYIPGFADGLVGHKVPGSCTLDVTFPADFQSEALRGKKAQFAMTLHELKRREKPQLDDDFAVDLGKDSLQAMRQEITTRLDEEASREAEQTQRRKLLEALAKRYPVELPPSMVDRQVERTIENLGRRMEMMTQRAYKFSDDELADLRSSSREEAEFQVRSGLLIAAMGEAEKLHVDDAAVHEAVHEVAAGAGAQASQVHAYYKNEDHFEEKRFELLEGRVMASLKAHAKIVPAAAQDGAEGGLT